MIYIFYHVCCIDKTFIIVRDQISKIVFSGLYEKVNTIHCYLVGHQKYIDQIKTMLLNSGKKFKISGESPYIRLYERFTLEDIRHRITPQDKLLYIHTKGITRMGSRYEKGVWEWRNYMEYFLFSKASECIELLNQYDLVGLLYSKKPMPHFSGNFWWSTGKYYLSLPPKIGMSYLDTEMYIHKNNPNFYILHKPSAYPGYETKWSFSRYIEK